MMTKLIKKSDLSKLQFLRYLIVHQPATLKDIMDFFDLPRSTAKRTLDELIADLDFVSSDSEILVHTEDHSYQLNHQDQRQLIQAYLSLKAFYCDNSIPFTLLKLLLFNEVNTVASACKILNISQGHCYRTIISLNKILKEFDITIKNNYDNFYLSGREETIRLICFIMLTKTYLSVKWPFSSMSIADIESQIEPKSLRAIKQLSIAEKEKFYYLYMIRLKRFKFRQNFQPLLTSQHELLTIFMKTNDITKAILDSSKQFELGLLSIEEVGFMNFFSRMFFPKIDSRKNRQKIGKMISKLDNVYSCFFSHFIKQFMKTLGLKGTEILYETTYMVALCFLFDCSFRVDGASLILIPYVNEDQTVEQRSPLYTMTSDFLTDYIQENQQLHPEVLKEFKNKELLLDILYSLVATYNHAQLNVYISFNHKPFTTEQLLGNKLKKIFNQESFQIIYNADQADLIISDSPADSSRQADFFFFGDFNEPLLWEKLIKYIQDKIIEKLYSALLE